jgi:hypothetical protein
MMLEYPVKWRRAIDIADQADRGWVEVGWDRDPLFLGGVDHGLNREVIA